MVTRLHAKLLGFLLLLAPEVTARIGRFDLLRDGGEAATARHVRRNFRQTDRGLTCEKVESLHHESNEEIDNPVKVVTCLLDIAIVLDGSWGVDDAAWRQAKTSAMSLVSMIKGGTGAARVAVEVFGGPQSYDDMQKCTSSSDPSVLEQSCGMQWVSHFADDYDNATLVAKIDGLAKPGGTASTSHAMTQVQTELMYSRPDAPVAVVVLTAGQPISHPKLGAASSKLRSSSVRIAWVLIGGNTPTVDIHQWYDETYDTLYQLHPDQPPACAMKQVVLDACGAFGSMKVVVPQNSTEFQRKFLEHLASPQ